ncbi:MAG: tetratricopeptide repeat protein [Planctomycetes bacterium]|jgi:tetratricopeptide (TPR) repeat protein|nr:tetratricopeptide repeat protein [Planctomycetota bacterium]
MDRSAGFRGAPRALWLAAGALLAGLLAAAPAAAGEPATVRAEALLASGRFEEALRAAQEILGGDPEDLHARTLEAEALEGLGRIDPALDAFRAAYVASLPEMSARDRACRGILRCLHAKALDADERGDPEAALSWIGEALVFDTDFLAGILLRGRLLEDLGRIEEAGEEFRTALEKRPRDSDALLHAARYHVRGRRPAEAQPLLEALIASPAGSVPAKTLAWAHVQSAGIRREEGRRGAALVHLRAAADLDTADPSIRAALEELETFRREAEAVSRAETLLLGGLLAVLAAYAAAGIAGWALLRRWERRAGPPPQDVP